MSLTIRDGASTFVNVIFSLIPNPGLLPPLIFGLNIVETFHETSLQPIHIKGVIVADLA